MLPEGADEEAIRSWFYYIAFRTPNRFAGRINVTDAQTFLAMGIKGSGKSGLLGNIQARYKKLISGYGSRDDEVLADLRMSEFADQVPSSVRDNVRSMERGLIIGPASVSVTSSYDYVAYDKLTLNDIVNHDVIVVPQRVFPTMKGFFVATETLIDPNIGLLWSRRTASPIWYLKILEAANILYSRITLKRAKIDQAKAHLIFLEREMRHMGIAMGLDTQYSVSIDKEVRTNADATLIKNMGSDKLPADISWMYTYVHPAGFMALEKNEFVCKDKHGGVYLGWSQLPPWHKEPNEDIYATMGIRVEYAGDQLAQDLKDTDSSDVDPIVHMEIINVYNETGSFKGAVRLLSEKGTPHDRDTVKRHVAMHFSAKTCSCHKGAPSA